ncbi:MAG: universal stress protein [Acidimicrobiales bacterium]|jgi:nucleotide-binding universal stress UspA family protein
MPGAERRIVVGVDGSPPSERALDWAVAEAQRTGAALHLVSAWMFPMALGYAFTTTVHEVQQSARDVIDRAVAHVGEVAGDVTVTGETSEQLPGPALIAAAKGADLLVVGSRGLGGFEGLLIGSVSQYCTRHATCSVVVVR